MRTAGLVALPHVSWRHQPLGRREALAVHVGGGDCPERTVNRRRHTRNENATDLLDGTARPWVKHLRLAFAHAQTTPASVPETEESEHAQECQRV